MSDMPRRERREYTPEQKADAVRVVREFEKLSEATDPEEADATVESS